MFDFHGSYVYVCFVIYCKYSLGILHLATVVCQKIWNCLNILDPIHKYTSTMSSVVSANKIPNEKEINGSIW